MKRFSDIRSTSIPVAVKDRVTRGGLLLSVLLPLVFIPLSSQGEPLSQALQLGQIETLFQSPVNKDQLVLLREQLQLNNASKGDFTQYRKLKVLKKPLISKGNFIFDAELGLAWRQLHPFTSTLILKDDALIQIDSSGQVQISTPDDSQQANALSQTMATLLKALLSGELAQLAEHFEFYLSSDNVNSEPWLLGLIPKDELLKKAIPQMVLQGQQQLTALTLLSDNGDSSRIEFSKLSAKALSSQELELLSAGTVANPTTTSEP